jgi:hypothetical protein
MGMQIRSCGRSSNANKTMKMMKLLLENKQAINQDAAEDPHDDLIVALRKLSAAFQLD